jgi:hypothetical protein
MTSSSSSSTASPYVGIQIGLVAQPAQIKYHGYPGADDSKSKTRSVEAYIFDEDTITALKNYEASAHADHPDLELNSIFTEQEEGKNVCIRKLWHRCLWQHHQMPWKGRHPSRSSFPVQAKLGLIHASVQA